jgi:hypothetical protein
MESQLTSAVNTRTGRATGGIAVAFGFSPPTRNTRRTDASSLDGSSISGASRLFLCCCPALLRETDIRGLVACSPTMRTVHHHLNSIFEFLDIGHQCDGNLPDLGVVGMNVYRMSSEPNSRLSLRSGLW